MKTTIFFLFGLAILTLTYLDIFSFLACFLSLFTILGSSYLIKLINICTYKSRLNCEKNVTNVSKIDYSFSLIESSIAIFLIFTLNNLRERIDVFNASFTILICSIFLVAAYYFLNKFIKNIFLILTKKNYEKTSFKKESLFLKVFKYLILLCLIVIDSFDYYLFGFIYKYLVENIYDLATIIFFFMLCTIISIITMWLSYIVACLFKKPQVDRSNNIIQNFCDKEILETSNSFFDADVAKDYVKTPIDVKSFKDSENVCGENETAHLRQNSNSCISLDDNALESIITVDIPNTVNNKDKAIITRKNANVSNKDSADKTIAGKVKKDTPIKTLKNKEKNKVRRKNAKKVAKTKKIHYSREQLDAMWHEYVNNNCHFIKDTVKDLSIDDVDVILGRYKRGSKYYKLMENFFELRADKINNEITVKKIPFNRLDELQIKEKFNYKVRLKDGDELVIRDSFWYVSKQLNKNSNAIYNNHHYYQKIHYKLAIAQAKKMHKFYLNNKSKSYLKSTEQLHYDFEDVIFVYDWSKYHCNYSIDITSSGYTMKTEIGTLYYNNFIDKNGTAISSFIKQCLDIINYGDSMLDEYGKHEEKRKHK